MAKKTDGKGRKTDGKALKKFFFAKKFVIC
jgi:hypothetical protein